MITGEIKSKVDKIWDAFWSAKISDPLGQSNQKIIAMKNCNAFIMS